MAWLFKAADGGVKNANHVQAKKKHARSKKEFFWLLNHFQIWPQCFQMIFISYELCVLRQTDFELNRFLRKLWHKVYPYKSNFKIYEELGVKKIFQNGARLNILKHFFQLHFVYPLVAFLATWHKRTYRLDELSSQVQIIFKMKKPSKIQ